MQTTASPNSEVNFEVQLNFDTNEFKIVHGNFGNYFPSFTGVNNVFVGFSKDVSCSSLGEDISSCEGKDYVQLYYHDSFQSSYDHQSYSSSTSTFQDPTGTSPLEANSMFNSYFNGNQTKNGTNYCFDSGAAANTFGASATCLNYSLNDAKPNHLEKHLTRAVPTYNDTATKKTFFYLLT